MVLQPLEHAQAHHGCTGKTLSPSNREEVGRIQSARLVMVVRGQHKGSPRPAREGSVPGEEGRKGTATVLTVQRLFERLIGIELFRLCRPDRSAQAHHKERGCARSYYS